MFSNTIKSRDGVKYSQGQKSMRVVIIPYLSVNVETVYYLFLM